MLKKIFVVIFIGSLGANFFSLYLLDKALFLRKHIQQTENSFINQGIHLKTVEEASKAWIDQLGVFIGGSFVKFWYLPHDLPIMISNQGGMEEKIITDYQKLQNNIIGSGIDFLFINSGFCEIHTAINTGKDVDTVIDNNFSYLKKIVEDSVSNGITPVITTLSPIRPVFIFPYTKLFSISSEKKRKENKAIQKYNQMLRLYASDNMIYLVDFEKILADDQGFLKKEFSVTDGEHIDVEGYDYLDVFFKKTLIKILAEKYHK